VRRRLAVPSYLSQSFTKCKILHLKSYVALTSNDFYRHKLSIVLSISTLDESSVNLAPLSAGQVRLGFECCALMVCSSESARGVLLLPSFEFSWTSTRAFAARLTYVSVVVSFAPHVSATAFANSCAVSFPMIPWRPGHQLMLTVGVTWVLVKKFFDASSKSLGSCLTSSEFECRSIIFHSIRVVRVHVYASVKVARCLPQGRG
ncbi:hypothetical protein R3P38DRAFT_2999192, partial [Favolaschia claudopus]